MTIWADKILGWHLLVYSQMLLEGFDAYGENKTLVDSNSCQCKDVRLLLMQLHMKSFIAFHLSLQETHNVEREQIDDSLWFARLQNIDETDLVA